MKKLHLGLAGISFLALAGCAQFGPTLTAPGAISGGATVDGAPSESTPAQATPAQATALALSATEIGAYLDPEALKLLSQKERAEAASAQFYALQFGRPGAPRLWQGDSGASGKISVGPYVRVNALACREFAHAVTISGKEFLHGGTACREENGQWSVA